MRSTLEENKRALIILFTEGRKNLLTLAGKIPINLQDQVFLGAWSIRDILAHLIGWDYSNLEAVRAIASSRLPAFYEFIDKDWHTYNARLVDMHKKGDIPDLVQGGQASQKTLIDRLSDLSAKELYKDHGVRYRGYKVIIARLIEAETRDEIVHLEQIRSFVASIPAGDRKAGLV
jgi:hypothetical protein